MCVVDCVVYEVQFCVEIFELIGFVNFVEVFVVVEVLVVCMELVVVGFDVGCEVFYCYWFVVDGCVVFYECVFWYVFLYYGDEFVWCQFVLQMVDLVYQ